jgi:valyl-tRNA synthetase
LIHTLETLLRALHPLAPFISEEIWQRVRVPAGMTGTMLMQSRFPVADAAPPEVSAETEMRWVMDFIEGIRQIRSGMDIAPSRKLTVLLHNAGPADREYLERNLHYLTRLAGVDPPRALAPGEAAPIAAVALLGHLEILVPMAGLIEPEAELERLAKRLRKADSDAAKLTAKLSNADFVRSAPPEVVAKDRARLAELDTELAQLQAQIDRVNQLRSG